MAIRTTICIAVCALSALAVAGWSAEGKKGQRKPRSKGKHPVIVMETTRGTLEITLYPEDAPKHSANFEKLVSEKFYDGVVFHRVEKDPEPFVVQAGDPVTKKNPSARDAGTHDATDASGKEYKIDAEIKRPHRRGTLAMARQEDRYNPQRRSSSSQFYICLDDRTAEHLDGAYTAFGQVTRGMDVVDKIQRGDKIKKASVKK